MTSLVYEWVEGDEHHVCRRQFTPFQEAKIAGRGNVKVRKPRLIPKGIECDDCGQLLKQDAYSVRLE